MKTFLFAAATCLGLVVPMALVALTTGDARAARALAYDVRFNDNTLPTTAKPGPGDRIVLSGSLWQEERSAGRVEGACTVTSADGTAICNASLMLSDGTIAIQFIDAPPPSTEFAVVGGTGAYQGLAGSGTLLQRGDQAGVLTLTLG